MEWKRDMDSQMRGTKITLLICEELKKICWRGIIQGNNEWKFTKIISLESLKKKKDAEWNIHTFLLQSNWNPTKQVPFILGMIIGKGKFLLLAGISRIHVSIVFHDFCSLFSWRLSLYNYIVYHLRKDIKCAIPGGWVALPF